MIEGITEENLKTVEAQMAELHAYARGFRDSSEKDAKTGVLAYVHECNKLIEALRDNNIGVLVTLVRIQDKK